jgi:hypothetical protein
MADTKNNGALTNHQRANRPGLATEISRGTAERYKAMGYTLPLDFLMQQFQAAAIEANGLDNAVDCAKAALPYVHQKLPPAAVDNSAAKHEEALAELDDAPEADASLVAAVLAEPATDAKH